MQAFTFTSHKAGQGTTVTASAAAFALAQHGYRVALVSNDADIYAVLGAADHGNLIDEVTSELFTIDARNLNADADALAELVGITDDAPRFDVIVTDLHDATPTQRELVAAGFTDAQPVEVVTPCYLALRQSTHATNAAGGNAYGIERTHVVVVTEEGRALTVGDVRAVLKPSGDVIEIKRDTRAARAVDAGLLINRLPSTFDTFAQWITDKASGLDTATLDAADRELAALKARRAAQ